MIEVCSLSYLDVLYSVLPSTLVSFVFEQSRDIVHPLIADPYHFLFRDAYVYTDLDPNIESSLCQYSESYHQRLLTLQDVLSTGPLFTFVTCIYGAKIRAAAGESFNHYPQRSDN